jgi:hypothetical protein
VLSFTGGGGRTEAAAMVKGMLKRVCLQCESKGASRSSGSTLNSNREREGREGRRKGQAAAGAYH